MRTVLNWHRTPPLAAVELEAPRRVQQHHIRGSNDTPLWKEVPPVAPIVPPPSSFCPLCGLEGEGHLRDADGVMQARYLDAAGHIWSLSWFLPNGDAA